MVWSDEEQEETVELPVDPKVRMVESDKEQQKTVEPQGAGGDKKGVPSDQPVPPQSTPAAGKGGDEGQIASVSFRGAEISGSRFGYMSWSPSSDPSCQPS